MVTPREEVCFMDDDGPSEDLPAFISTTNARELFGLRAGETVFEAMARSQKVTEQAAKSGVLPE